MLLMMIWAYLKTFFTGSYYNILPNIVRARCWRFLPTPCENYGPCKINASFCS